MGQFSWTMLKSKPASLSKALKSGEKCIKEITRSLSSSAHKVRVLSQLESFIKSLQEIEASQGLGDLENLPCLSFVQASGVIQLHPSFLGNVSSGIYSYLSNFLMHYDEDLKGVWVSCGNVKQLDSLGYLTSGDACGLVTFKVALKILVFIPKLDDIIGKINRMRPTSISVLIYGVFNATIKSEDVKDTIQYDGTQYKTVTGERIIDNDTIIPLKITNVTVLPKNRWVNLTAILNIKQ
ncbi:RNA polymerase Rpb7, N-terminal domain containing protein [Theileria equi strain WA]|uniref:RNA polymerase Rpb7, N-terminal domain containing protein n=1 Tax=Theileria equi strain WA TaxID=1537102 RepID=L0AXD3_THEEQ|nr:RNA polymerase Rpb7, N-terminal domain containing protein [Theileria equi strain WA]AFZ79686.1 RNA polymerase Rpb7, N-terminal domain containing protein [Theileria equi strain WA]|eukprot:XP_004829352.1 RNA polymerase Rpb7, N-terminal domain containing protein [Theileria equi strain WA]